MLKRALILFVLLIAPALAELPRGASDDWFAFYYRNPQPEKFVDSVRDIVRSGSISTPSSKPPLIVFLGRVMAENPAKIEAWMSALNDLSPEGKDLLYAALWFSRTDEAKRCLEKRGIQDYVGKNPPDVLKMEIDSPTVIDMLWGWYFATGDQAALRRIIAGFNLNPQAGAADRYKSSAKAEKDKRAAYQDLAFRAAERSLLDNCVKHQEVRWGCEKLYAGSSLNQTEMIWLGVILSKVDPKKYKIEPGPTQWTENGRPVSAKPNAKTVQGFGVMLFLTDNSRLFEDRKKDSAVGLTPLSKARRGVPVYTALLLSGPGVDAAGSADITFDMRVRRPDGTVFAQAKDAVGWKGAYDASLHSLQLSKGHMAIQINPGDLPGVYTVEITVRDRIRKIEVPVQTTFEVP